MKQFTNEPEFAADFKEFMEKWKDYGGSRLDRATVDAIDPDGLSVSENAYLAAKYLAAIISYEGETSGYKWKVVKKAVRVLGNGWAQLIRLPKERSGEYEK